MGFLTNSEYFHRIFLILAKKRNVSDKYPEIEKKIVKTLKREKSIIAAYVFGSFQNRTNTPLSDIDIAVLLSDGFKNSTHRIDFESQIENLLKERIAEYNFDVKTLNTAPLVIKGKIITNGKLLFTASLKKVVDFEENTLIKYLDFKPEYDKLIDYQINSQLNG